MASFNRRDFLRITVVAAVAAPLPACGSDGGTTGTVPSSDSNKQRSVYPQGVASGDPTPTSVILWTRVEPEDDHAPSVKYQVATDSEFAKVVASGELFADPGADHTVKLKITKLDPGAKYYYRFTALDVYSVTGETKTAPAAASDVPLRFAFATCQDFVGRQYHSWRALVEETKDDPLDFVVYLGDYIYETDGDPSFQTPNADRKIVLPDGLNLGDGGGKAAQTLEDYRALYRQYRSDEFLQEVHRLYPFVAIWDDHEFGNDCWSDHTTHFNELNGNEEKVPEQRQDADRAWFEYTPAEVEYKEGAAYPNDIKIYRKLRFGKHLELFMTDERYYRDDHVIPEGPVNLDVAKFAKNSEIGSRIFVLKKGFDPLEAAKKPTMLGEEQKQWLLDSIKASEATWKIWGSEVQLAQMVANLKSFDTLPDAFRDVFYLTVDQWDGYRTERSEILGELESVDNLVVIVGDIHASYASHLYADFDNPSDTPAAVEYTIAGISSFAVAPAAKTTIDGDATLSALGLGPLVDRWDELLREASPHYQYANSSTNGVAIVDLSADKVEVTYVHVADPRETAYEIVERQRFRTTAGVKKVEVLSD
jgi:alkaline phosphatase D